MLIFAQYACYEELEACLDPLAKNYTLAADETCDGCCEYPALEIRVNHFYGNAVYALNKSYVNNIGDSFSITQQSIYISNIQFINEKGEVLDNLTTKAFTENSSAVIKISNFCLVKANSVSCLAGSARFAGNITQAKFRLGLDPSLASLDSASVSRDAVLTWKEPAWLDHTYYGLYFRIKSADNVERNVYVPTDASFNLNALAPSPNAPGQAIQFAIKVNYEILFRNVSFKTMTDKELSDGIIANISEAFSAS